MGVVFRQSIKATIVTLVGALLGALVVYLFTNFLSPTEFGFSKDILNKAVATNYIMLLGVGYTMHFYIQKYDSSDERRKTLITIATITPLVTTLLFTILYAFGRPYIINLYKAGDEAYVNTYYYALPVLILVWSYMTLFEVYLLSQLKVAIPAFLREVVLKVLNIILLTLIYFQLIDFHTFIISLIAVHIIPVLGMVLVASRTDGFGFSFNWNVFSKKEYKELLHFSWYHMLMGVSITYMEIIDIVLLPVLANDGFVASAIYNIAIYVRSVMIIPYKAMANAAFPVLNKAYIDKDDEKVRDLFQRSGVNIFLVAVAMFLLIGLNLDNLVAILPENYEAVKPVVLILMVGRLVDMGTGLNNEMISISKYYTFNFRLSLFLLLLAVGLMFVLIPSYGLYGAAWSMTIALAIFNVIKTIFLWKKLKMLPFSKGFLFIILSGIITGAIVYCLPFIVNPIVDTIIRTIAIAAIYLPILLLFKVSGDLNQYVTDIIKNKRLF